MREVTETRKVFKFNELSNRIQSKVVERYTELIKETLDFHKVLREHYRTFENDYAFEDVTINFSKNDLEKGLNFNFSANYTFEYEENLMNFFHEIKFPYDSYPDFLNRFQAQDVDLEIYTYRSPMGFGKIDNLFTQVEISIGDYSGVWDEEDAKEFREELRKYIQAWYINLCNIIHNQIGMFIHEKTHFVNVREQVIRLAREFYEDGSIYIPK